MFQVHCKLSIKNIRKSTKFNHCKIKYKNANKWKTFLTYLADSPFWWTVRGSPRRAYNSSQMTQSRGGRRPLAPRVPPSRPSHFESRPSAAVTSSVTSSLSGKDPPLANWTGTAPPTAKRILWPRNLRRRGCPQRFEMRIVWGGEG